jgi:hypothetical protein
VDVDAVDTVGRIVAVVVEEEVTLHTELEDGEFHFFTNQCADENSGRGRGY